MRVAIAHTPADTAFTEALAEALRSAGAEPFIVFLTPDSPFNDRAHFRLDEADAVIFVLSPSSINDERLTAACAWYGRMHAASLTALIVTLLHEPFELLGAFQWLNNFQQILQAEDATLIAKSLAYLLLPEQEVAPPEEIDSVAQSLSMGIALIHQKRYSLAASYAKVILSREPQLLPALSLAAIAALDDTPRRLDEALGFAEQMIALAPENIRSWGLLGRTYGEAGRYTEAIQVFTHAIEIDPTDIPARHNKGYTFFISGDIEAARVELEILLQHNMWDIDSWNLYGLILLNLNKYDEALDAFNRALSIEPTDKVILTNKGICQGKQGDYEAIRATYDEALALYPLDNDVWFYRGEALFYAEHDEEALSSVLQAQELGRDEAWELLGDIYFALQRFDDAANAYSQFTAQQPNSYVSWLKLGNAQFWAEYYIASLVSFQRVAEIKPDNSFAFKGMSLALRHLQREQEAVEYAQKAVQLDATNAENWEELGYVLRTLARYDEAAAAFGHIVEIEPQSVEGWLNYSALQRGAGKFEAALQTTEQALALIPNENKLLTEQGYLLFRLGHYAQALAVYSQLIQSEPAEASHWLNRGLTYMPLQQYAEAIHDFDATLERHPDIELAHRNRGKANFFLERFADTIPDFLWCVAHSSKQKSEDFSYLANALYREMRYDETLEFVEKGLAISAEWVKMILLKALALHALGRYADVLATSETGLSYEPDNAWLWSLKGSALCHLGDLYTGYDAIDKAVELDPKVPLFGTGQQTPPSLAVVWQTLLASFAALFAREEREEDSSPQEED